MFKTVKEQLFTDPKQIFADKFTARECVISSFMETCKNWKIRKQLWQHELWARVSTAFLVFTTWKLSLAYRKLKRGYWPMRTLQLAKYRLKPNERLANHWFQFTASQDRKNINAVLVAICFTFWWTMAAGSFMPVVFCILFISCWLVQTESFNSNHVGKRTVKVNIWIFYVQVSLNVRRASLCSSLK